MTMAKVDDPKPPGWDAPPLPLRGRKSGRKGFPLQHLGIRHLMVVLVYFAIVFWAGKQFLDTNGAVQLLLLGALVGLGICAFGVWAAMKLTRYSFIGWVVFIFGCMGL